MIWRYIPPFSAPGSIQMAVDSWLFHQHRQGFQPPCLRFYTWFPATLSLGHFQKRWPEHWSQLVWQGQPLSLVRRPSGGRGVLHQGDLTYSLVNSMASGTRSDAYEAICQFLIEGWRKLGLLLQFGTVGRGYHHEANCFRLATGADLVGPNGQKLIGSAQLWRGSSVLQHGSMALEPNLELQTLVFGDQHAKSFEWPTQMQSLDLATIIDSLKQAAMDVFEIDFRMAPISSQEWEEIAHYMDTTKV